MRVERGYNTAGKGEDGVMRRADGRSASARAVAQRRHRVRAAAAASLAVLAILALSAANAPARVVHLNNGHRLSVEPARGGAPAGALATSGSGGKLEYHGGPIMPSNTNYALYW